MNIIPKLREGTIKDIDFIIEAIIESEKSGTSKLSYQTIFLLDIEKIKILIKNLLLENVPGQQYCISNFIIAEINGENAGACSAWIEGETGLSSSLIRANLLLDFIDHANFKDVEAQLEMAHSISIKREFGSLQIDNVYVKPGFRGLNISGLMIQEHIERNKKENEDLKVQIILNKTNKNAYRSYAKWGFEIISEVTSKNKEILNYLPADTNILMEKIIS